MHISNFDDLLTAARNQSTAQRLLFVFTAIELPADSTEQQRADFAAGRGGAFTPLMCVDRSPQEVHSFTELCREATQFDQPWRMVFAAALSGTAGCPPSEPAIAMALQRMVDDVKEGRLGAYIPFDTHGEPVQIG